jgi:DNA polymerase-3 subunit beta
MPTLEGGSTLEFSVAEMKQTLQQVLFAVSNDDARPVLTAVYMHADGEKLYVAATDSYRLAEKTLSRAAGDISLLLPSQSLQELLRSLKDDTASVQLSYDEQQARFKVLDVEIVTRLVDGQYPDYKKLLPKSFETTARYGRTST